ncbi:MAG: SPASM domain-containing protein [Elusimicrobia bacterium]|nr:SPASM domain-containing protein [Elusimicrobiota bacterium]
MPVSGTLSLEENRARAWEGFLARGAALDSRPFKASFEITRNCNFKCVMCAQSWSPRYARYDPALNMDPALFSRVLSELAPTLEYAHLQGFGESTVSPHWPEIVEACRPYAGRVRFGLVTNLSRKDPEMWRRLVERDFTIIFSCDGATKETTETIRVGADFGQMLENLRVIQNARRELSRGRLYFYSVVQRLNYRELPALVDLAARVEADRITFTGVSGDPFLPAVAWKTGGPVFTRARKLYSSALKFAGVRPRQAPRRGTPLGLDGVSERELAALREDALSRAKASGVRVVLSDARLAGGVPKAPALDSMPAGEAIAESIRVAAHGRCFKPHHYVAIGYNGDVGTCNYLAGDDAVLPVGNLSRSSFEDIWNSPEYQSIRRALSAGRPDNDGCRWCFERRIGE